MESKICPDCGSEMEFQKDDRTVGYTSSGEWFCERCYIKKLKENIKRKEESNS